MTKDKADYTGQINSKKLGGTGITEALIGKHHRAEKGSLTIVANISVAATGKNVKEGTGSVHYVIDDLEVAPTTAGAADHVQHLLRSFEYERRLETEGHTLFDERGDEPTVEQVITAGEKHKPHPFLPANAADDNGICEICGVIESANPLHDAKARQTDPFTVPDPDEEDEDEDGDELPYDGRDAELDEPDED